MTQKALVFLVVFCAFLGCRTKAEPNRFFLSHANPEISLIDSISGTYENEGQTLSGQPASLATIFAAGTGDDLGAYAQKEYFRSISEAPFVELKVNGDDRFTVVVPGTSFSRSWSSLPKGPKIQWKDGVFSISCKLNGSAVNEVGWTNQIIEIQRQGPYLLVHHRMKWYGIVLLIPAWNTYEIWAKFKSK